MNTPAIDASAVDVRSLSKWFVHPSTPSDRILDDINLRVVPAEFVTILGPSGCGKSTLLRIIAGLEAPSAGSVSVAGVPPDTARREHRYAIVFQQPGLLEWRDVRANVALPLQIAGVDRSVRADRAEELLDLVGLGDVGSAKVWELSGGMQQRVALARALILRPEVLLLDEPFAALDELTREHLQTELALLQRETGVAVLMVTHSIREAVTLGDRVLVMGRQPGRWVAEVDTVDTVDSLAAQEIARAALRQAGPSTEGV